MGVRGSEREGAVRSAMFTQDSSVERAVNRMLLKTTTAAFPYLRCTGQMCDHITHHVGQWGERRGEEASRLTDSAGRFQYSHTLTWIRQSMSSCDNGHCCCCCYPHAPVAVWKTSARSRTENLYRRLYHDAPDNPPNRISDTTDT